MNVEYMEELRRNELLRRERAKLNEKLAILDEELGLNPKQYLFGIERAHIDLLETLEQVEYALSPDYFLEFWEENCNKKVIPHPSDFQGEALIRCNKALEVLQEYKDNKAPKDYGKKEIPMARLPDEPATIYLLFDGSSSDGRGDAKYVGWTRDVKAAKSHLRRKENNPHSLAKVHVVTKQSYEIISFECQLGG